jgi:hypothetical protein
MSSYNYSKYCNLDQLKKEIEKSIITVALSHIDGNAESVTIHFKDILSTEQVSILNEIVFEHSPEDTTEPQPVAIYNTEIDDQGRQVLRVAAASKGWTYLARSIEFETSTLGSLYSKNFLGNNNTDVSIAFYDANNNQVTEPQYESDVVTTKVVFKPNHDYEIVSGHLHQQNNPSTDVRIWVIGGIIELGQGYVKELASGLNMKYIGADEQIATDGRASKYMKKDVGAPYHANQLQIIVRHDAGYKHKLMLVLEYFRE